jgi:hypothetical protein
MAEQQAKSRLTESLKKRDKYGAILKPGDVCIWGSKAGAIICIYAGGAPGGMTGQYGSFHTPVGLKSIRYKNIVAAYDSMGQRIINHDITKRLMREFYG